MNGKQYENKMSGCENVADSVDLRERRHNRKIIDTVKIYGKNGTSLAILTLSNSGNTFIFLMNITGSK